MKYIDLLIFFFGFTSGFLLLTTGNTLNFWLSSEGINIKTIGFFSIISFPYSINFIWIPIIEKLKIKNWFLDTRNLEGWISPISIGISVLFIFISLLNISDNINLIAILSLFVAVLSSTQDIIFNSIRSEITPGKKFGFSTGNYSLGYRFGMIISGSFAMFISSFVPWSTIYLFFSLFTIFLLLIIKKLMKYNNISSNNHDNKEIKKLDKINFISVIKSISPNNSIIFLILLFSFLILYRLPDNFISVMLNPFLFQVGFNEIEISIAGKFFGMMGAIIGTIISRNYIDKLSISRSLVYFGILHSLAHLTYILLLYTNKSVIIFSVATLFESITGGMAFTAYIALITSLCNGKNRATQYSVMSCMMGLSRTLFPSISGIWVSYIGWQNFYIFSAVMILPSLAIIKYLDMNLKNIKNVR